MTGPSPTRDSPPLLLLHGALGSSGQMGPLARALEGERSVLVHDFSGHGKGSAGPGGGRGPGGFSMSGLAEEVVRLLDRRGIERADVFGYSMGGYVGLLAARTHPGRIGRIMTLATKFAWDPETARRETARLDPDNMLAKVPAFAGRLRALHGERWAELVRATAAMMAALGANPELTADGLRTIANECLIAVGDRDAMVGVEETLTAARSLPAGRCLVLPGTPHPLEQVEMAPLLYHVRAFLK